MCSINSLDLCMDGFPLTDEILLREIRNSTAGIRYEYIHKKEDVLIRFFDHVTETLRGEKWIVVKIDLASVNSALKDNFFFDYVAREFAREIEKAGIPYDFLPDGSPLDIREIMEDMSETISDSGARLLLILEHFQLISRVVASESQLVTLRELPCVICYIANIAVTDIEHQLFPESYSGNSTLYGTITKRYYPLDEDGMYENVQSAVSDIRSPGA